MRFLVECVIRNYIPIPVSFKHGNHRSIASHFYYCLFQMSESWKYGTSFPFHFKIPAIQTEPYRNLRFNAIFSNYNLAVRIWIGQSKSLEPMFACKIKIILLNKTRKREHFFFIKLIKFSNQA